MKLNLALFNRHLQIRYFKTPMIPVAGYTSRTGDGLHVLFLDYDMVCPEVVLEDLKLLEECISHAFLFCTYEKKDASGVVGNYHVICVDKFTYAEIHDIMGMTHTDTYHKDLAKQTRYRSWVLRFSKKGKRPEPKFMKFISFSDPDREQSRAHLNLVLAMNPKAKEEIKGHKWELDKSIKAQVTHYNTGVEKKAE